MNEEPVTKAAASPHRTLPSKVLAVISIGLCLLVLIATIVLLIGASWLMMYITGMLVPLTRLTFPVTS